MYFSVMAIVTLIIIVAFVLRLCDDVQVHQEFQRIAAASNERIITLSFYVCVAAAITSEAVLRSSSKQSFRGNAQWLLRDAGFARSLKYSAPSIAWHLLG